MNREHVEHVCYMSIRNKGLYTSGVLFLCAEKALASRIKASANHFVRNGRHVTTPNDNDGPVECYMTKNTKTIKKM